MKDAQGSVTTTTNIDTGRRKKMTVHVEAFGKMMSMFSNQYSNGPLAVVREYFCNGDDSRMAAGSDRPTEVWMPTDLNPEILIRDFGLGLDAEGLEVTFATYLLSTKDEDDEATGHFGIGSKAAFTLGQQFTVTGFKDGQKVAMLLALDEKGEPFTDILFEGPTDEPNGVLVSVGVPDVAAMREATEEFFLTVPKGRALINGQPPEHVSDNIEFTRFNDEVMIVKDGEGAVRLQMGPVVYRVSKAIMRAVAARLDGLDSQAVAKSLMDWDETDSVLMEVAMGDVNIAPSREDLRDTDATVNRVASVVQGIHDYIVHDVQAKIDASSSRWQAMGILSESLETLRGFKVSKKAFGYNGIEKAFKTEVKVEHPTIFLRKKSWKSDTMVVEQDTSHTVDFSRMGKTLVVAGVFEDDVSKVKRYAKRFIEDNEQGFQWIVVTEDFSGEAEWFQWGIGDDGVATWTLDEYRAALRGMRDVNPRTANEPSYTTGWRASASRDLDDRDLLTDIINAGLDIVIFHESSRVSPEIVALVEEKYTPVVLLAQQSENALRKRVAADGSVSIVDIDWQAEAKAQIIAKVKAEIPAPTGDERLALGAAEWIGGNSNTRWVDREYVNVFENWRRDLIETVGGYPTPLTHPLFHDVEASEEMARLIAADLTEDRQADLQRLRKWCGVEFEPIPFEFEDESAGSMVETFPLLRAYDDRLMKRDATYRREVIAYINSKA